MKTDWALIKSYFEFLQKQHEATIIAEMDYGIEYKLKNCRVRLMVDRDQLMIDFCPPDNNRWLGLGEIINTRDPETHFKYASFTLETMKSELETLVKAFTEYSRPFIEGDFSIAPKVEIYRKKRLKELGI